jgi:hypothetical protein
MGAHLRAAHTTSATATAEDVVAVNRATAAATASRRPYPTSALVKGNTSAEQRAKAVDILMTYLLPLLRQLILFAHEQWL